MLIAAIMAWPVALAAMTGGAGSGAAGTPASATALSQIPLDLLAVYQAAASTCGGLPWQVLAAIGWIESHHANGHADPATGDVRPPVFGPPLDGHDGRAAIADPNMPDRWAHAEGPMQFIANTWASWARLAPGRTPGAVPDPQNAWDAIYAAAAYLCAGQPALRDLDAAILRYNFSTAYLDEVLSTAVAYGLTTQGNGTMVGGSGAAVVLAAMSVIGTPYVWGGASPSEGFDCSGLVQWAYRQVGVAIPRTTYEQVAVGDPVPLGQLTAGDLLFSRGVEANGSEQALGHVAIYAGGGEEVVAPHTGAAVRLEAVDYSAVQAARRVLTNPGQGSP
jgi:hypothetical protein